MRDRRGQGCPGRKPQQTIHHEFSHGQRIRGIPGGHEVRGVLREVAPKSRVMHSKQVLDAGVFENRPKILDKTRLGVQTKQIAKRLHRRGNRPMVTTADVRDHISEPIHVKPVRAEFHMSGLMRSHDQKQPLVGLGSGVAS